METTGETEEDAEVPASGAVKAKIQLWESGDTLSLHRKDVKNKTFRQSLYSDSSLRRPTTRDPRSVRLPLLHIDTGEDTTSVQPRDAGERTAGSSDFKGRRLRMASTGSMLEASDVLAAALEQMDGIIAGSRHDIQNITPSHNPSDWWQTPQNVGQVHSHSQSQGQLNVTATRVSRLLGDVKYSLEASEDKEEVKNMLSRDLVDYLKDWIMSEDYFLSGTRRHNPR
ncbi:uncharacterized protein [Littorina saxatilis]|uniref:uncharacterized protein n=1 Tax=Littorina saxatilis TaxID=31220 RepID=UPI0038B4EB2E